MTTPIEDWQVPDDSAESIVEMTTTEDGAGPEIELTAVCSGRRSLFLSL